MADTQTTEMQDTTQTATDQPEAQDFATQFGEHGENLPEEYRGQLKSLVQKFAQRELYARRFEIRLATKQRFFMRGLQQLVWDRDSDTYQISTQGGGGTTTTDAAKEPNLWAAYNIYLGYAKSFMAVFCQNRASVRFEAENPLDPNGIAAEEEADKFRKVYEKFNDPKDAQAKIAKLLWTDGRVIGHTRYVVDGQRFGTEDDGTPKGREVTDYYGVLESKVPVVTKDIHDWPYCCISQEYDLSKLKAKYKWARDDIKGGGAGSQAEEYARNNRVAVSEGGVQQSGSAIAHLGTENQWWMRPEAFEELEDTWRDKMLQLFPDGLKVTFVGSTFVEAIPENMDEHINVLHALPGDGQSRPSIGNPVVTPQETFNNLVNLSEETYEYTVPATWVQEGVVDIEAIQEQEAAPGQHIPCTNPSPASPLADSFFVETAPSIPTDMFNFMEMMQGPLAQFLSSQQPALFGQADTDQKTARGFQMMRDQALGILAVTWLPFKVFYSGVVLDAVVCAAKNRKGNLAMRVPAEGQPGKTQVVTVDVAKLRANLLCSPETDENFPESWSQQSARFQALMTGAEANPAIGAVLMHPDNQALAKRLIGIPGLVIPGADSRDKQLQEIADMQGQSTVADPQQVQALMQQSGGLPPDPQMVAALPQTSSIPVDPVVDDHAMEAAECKRWLNSPEGQKAKREQPEWYANVRQHMLEHLQAQAALMPPPMQMPAPAGKPPAAKPNPGAEQAPNPGTGAQAAGPVM